MAGVVIRPLILFSLVGLAGCSTYSTIRERDPRYVPAPGCAEPLATAQAGMVAAQARERRAPLEALAGYLTAAQIAARELERNPQNALALKDYNFAVSRIVKVIEKAKLDPWAQPLRVPAAGGDFVLRRKPDPRPQWNPALYHFTPADEFDVNGTYVKDRVIRPGLGAPVVAVGRAVNRDAKARYGMPRTYYGVTAIARFRGRECELGFEDPLAVETVRMDGRTYPLGADFTVPLAVMLARNDPKKLEISRLLQPGKYADTARLVRLQPYDPNKTVLLVVHGLMDTQATWTPMINALRADPEFRRRYQVWFYSYPSGYPYPYSAALLRKELDGVQKVYPLRRKMVVVGHSMGGCISRLLITDSGDQLWEKIFHRKPADTPLSPASRELFTEALVFSHRPEVGRVIFIAAPLKGSNLATHWLGRIGSSLVHSPTTLLQAGRDMQKILTFQTDDLKLRRIPNSVDTLAPNNRFVRAINEVPLTSGIPYHVISGDRGKGGNHDQTPPQKSDGVVPYWSSHMPGAESELVVPSAHPAHQNPEAIAEVRRILLLPGN